MTIQEIIERANGLSDNELALLKMIIAVLESQNKALENALIEQEERIKRWFISMKGNGLL